MPEASPELTPDSVDAHVGAQVRALRKALRMSQTELAQALGLTFQQVQKYERGTNRISASKLWQIAHTLNAPVAYFFQGLDTSRPEAKGGEDIQALSQADHGDRLARAFLGLRDSDRKLVVAVAERLSGAEPDDRARQDLAAEHPLQAGP